VVIVGKTDLKEIKECSTFVFRGYFDGTFCNLRRFPGDASMYLFLRDPESPKKEELKCPLSEAPRPQGGAFCSIFVKESEKI